MAYTLDQSQTTSNGAAALGSAVYRLASTFTAGVSEDLTKVELLMYREGTPPNITVEIHGTDGSGYPDNTPLASQSVDISGITTDSGGEWVEVVFNTPMTQVATTKYGIVVGDGWTDASNRFRWLQQTGADNYADGGKHYATTGENWLPSNYDMTFKTYYGAADEYINIAGSLAAISTVSGILTVLSYIDIAGIINAITSLTGTLAVSKYTAWPHDRPDDYDPDLNWDEDTQTWVSDYQVNPGNYVYNIVAVGENGDIYFGSF